MTDQSVMNNYRPSRGVRQLMQVNTYELPRPRKRNLPHWSLVLGHCCFLLSLSAAAELSDAEYLINNFHVSGDFLDSARNIISDCRTDDPTDEEALALWTRWLICEGDRAPGNGAKKQWYARAMAAAETLMAQNDQNAEGHMWWATAKGLTGELNGILNSALIVSALEREFKRAVELDPDFVPPHAALGTLYHMLPGFMGGDQQRSRWYLETGLSKDPNYSKLWLELARLELKQQRPALARQALERLLAIEEPTVPCDYVLYDEPAARKLLKKICVDD